MSGSISFGYVAGAPTADDYGTYGLLVSQSSQVRAQLNTLTEQASSGLVSSVFSGLGSGSKTTLDLRSEIAQQQAQIYGISSADQKLTLTQTVLTQIGSIASSFTAQAATLNNSATANIDVVAASARASLQQLAGLLDTKNGSDYLFAGSETGQAPVPNPDAILSSGFYTGINGAVQSLATNGGSATIASTLAIASSNAAGTSPFSPQLSQSPTTLRPGLASVDLGNGTRLTIGVAASANTAAVSGGSSTTGSYVRDLLRSLATIGSLSSAQANTPGFTALVQDTQQSLSSAVGALADEQGILGNTQTQVDGVGKLLTSTKTALTGQVSNIEDVDLAVVSTQLAQTQASLQASYKLISTLSTHSLLTYLPA